jgi:fumarate reductase subunit C
MKAVPRRPAYVRPMRGWWRRDPFFMRYMAREFTAVAVLAYAIVLTVGLVRLAQGQAAWEGWAQALRSPVSLVLHTIVLACLLLHAKTWFEIMPKTLPAMFIGSRRVPARFITRMGFAAAGAATALLLALASWWES